jgi:hypothetical protein
MLEPVLVLEPDPEVEPATELDPEPDVDPDPDVVPLEAFTAFVTIAPDGVSACQIPPTPCPFASPAFASPAKRYSGRPAYVT